MTEYKQHSFDAYCKTILRHAAANAHKARKRRAGRVIAFSALSAKELNEMYSYDRYPMDKQTYAACGREVEIAHEGLCAALERLTKCQRDILLLSCCFELTDAEIGAMLGLPRSTVQYRRRAALQYIRELMEGDDHERKHDLSE